MRSSLNFGAEANEKSAFGSPSTTVANFTNLYIRKIYIHLYLYIITKSCRQYGLLSLSLSFCPYRTASTIRTNLISENFCWTANTVTTLYWWSSFIFFITSHTCLVPLTWRFCSKRLIEIFCCSYLTFFH